MENEVEQRTTAIGYLNYGKSYLDCAVLLTQNIKAKTLCHTNTAPVYHLYGLAFELLFKAIVRTNCSTVSDFKKLGHDLVTLAKESQNSAGFSTLIEDVDAAQKDHWRKLRKRGREELLNIEPITSEHATLDSDEEIEEKLPDFMASLTSLNLNYRAPFRTRYFVRESITYPTLNSLQIPAQILLDRAEIPCRKYSKDHEGV